MKKYKCTIATSTIFIILSVVTEIFSVIRYFYARMNNQDLLNTFTALEWAVIFSAFVIVLVLLQYFSKKEGLRPITIIAQISLVLICFCAVMLIGAFFLLP